MLAQSVARTGLQLFQEFFCSSAVFPERLVKAKPRLLVKKNHFLDRRNFR